MTARITIHAMWSDEEQAWVYAGEPAIEHEGISPTQYDTLGEMTDVFLADIDAQVGAPEEVSA